ncbi:SRPBCC family protein [Leptolyngbya sp. FACHB-261]|uniref:SRPBCC family protein n=1 Tax=Leptolyngbya sp. FACHB-261 TaxID=2692806 RepID=UPI001685D035|nr:SRPBCC family protein [Leptolyngbya sp. FACHB-261]MBD2100738.1 SRPBCC family protein [Leptolyngbya sp. FACHB-261]
MPQLLEQSVIIHTKPEQIWALLAQPEAWPQWDPSLLKVTLDGSATAGATGILQSANGMKLPLQLLRVEPMAQLEYQVQLPGIRVIFERVLEAHNRDSCRLLWRVHSKGWLAWLLYPTQKRVFSREAQRSLQSLKQRAEQSL